MKLRIIIQSILMTYGLLFITASVAESQQPPKLSEEERVCVEGILGKPIPGQHPPREQAEAAFASCGIVLPDHPKPPPVPHKNLTKQEQECMESVLGKPEQGSKPTREEAQTAFEACGINPPEH